MTLTHEVRLVVERCARLPRGLAFVHLGPIEAVAAALRVPPAAIDRTREALGEPERRAEVIRDYTRAAAQAGPITPAAPARQEAPLGAAELIDAASRHELGTAFLRRAPLEVAAVTFGVHPDVVWGARELLERIEQAAPRGWAPLPDPSGATPRRTRLA